MNIRQWPQTARQSQRSERRACNDKDVCDFQVIGELKDNAQQLLLMGNDGQYYAYDLVTGDIVALSPDDTWSVDINFATLPHTHLPPAKVAS